jgi:hypothetical protein
MEGTAAFKRPNQSSEVSILPGPVRRIIDEPKQKPATKERSDECTIERHQRSILAGPAWVPLGKEKEFTRLRDQIGRRQRS